MMEYLEQRPILKFFALVLGLPFLAGIVIVVAGFILRWSSNVEYSNGFFFACVLFAAAGSVRAMLAPRAALLRVEKGEPARSDEVDGWNGLERFFHRRSLDFKLVVAAVVCLLTSILIAQG